jgi:hypothetical protein
MDVMMRSMGRSPVMGLIPRRSIAWLGAASLFAVLSAMTLAAPADAGPWTKPIAVTGQSELGQEADLLAGPSGYAVLLSIRRPQSIDRPVRELRNSRRGVFASVRLPGQARFGSPVRLTPRSVTDAKLAMAADGETFAIWDKPHNSDDLQVWRRSPTEDWAHFQTVTGASGARISMAPDGGAMLVRTSTEQAKQVFIRAPGGSFGLAQTLGLPHHFSGYAPFAIGNGQSGGLVVTDGDCLPAFGARVNAGVLTAGAEMAGQTCSPWPADMASSDGRSVVGLAGSVIRIASAYGASGFTAPVRVSARGVEAGPFEVEISEGGDAIVAWQQYSRAGHAAGVFAAAGPSGSPFRAPRRLAPRSFLSGLHMNPDGDAAAFVVNLRRSVRLEAVFRSAGGSWGEPEPISPRRYNDRLDFPLSALGPDGQAVAVWRQPCGRDADGKSMLLTSDRLPSTEPVTQSKRVRRCIRR